jgi:hypothetical protein
LPIARAADFAGGSSQVSATLGFGFSFQPSRRQTPVFASSCHRLQKAPLPGAKTSRGRPRSPAPAAGSARGPRSTARRPGVNGFTVTEFTAKVCALTEDDHTGYAVRQAGYDLRKLRGDQLLDKPGRTRGCHVPPQAARTIAALFTLREQVIAPILAGVRSPRMGRKPAHWTRVDRDYERIRIDVQTLVSDLAIETPRAA